MTDSKRHSPCLNTSQDSSFPTLTSIHNSNNNNNTSTIPLVLESIQQTMASRTMMNDLEQLLPEQEEEVYNSPNAFYFKRSTFRRPDSAEDKLFSAPHRSNRSPCPTISYSDTLHDNWVGPFRLPPPPSTVIIDNNNGNDNNIDNIDNNFILKGSALPSNEKKKARIKDATRMEQIPKTLLFMEPAQNDNETNFDMEMELSFAELDAVEQISQVFPEVTVDIIQSMVRRSSLRTVMNQLAEQSKGAWGEVDSICGIRKSLASGDCCSYSSSIHSECDDFLTQLDQVMEIFPMVNVNRSEELLKRHSINTVLILLASEGRIDDEL